MSAFAFRMNLRTLALLALAALPMLGLSSCSSTSKIKGIPDKLPPITLTGTVRTPPHSMPSHAYPFDSGGRYVSDWAAEGERRSGRSAAATSDDQEKWTGSHEGAATGRRIVIKTTTPKSKSSSSKTASSKSKSSKTKSGSSSGGGGSYVVKKGDTLSSIARRNGTSVAKIKSANGMSSDFLSVGKSLKIPR
ncbi:LysM peptidoglycan-binding domain-containing protein [Verrucomicrobium sp. BvORR106]|uniref:LysM peptidoglycan-binding domain-containing protein n=1 Tax=Verrucomicrobium sp. BvORR106 TaxID=1403819 RepID=UPI0009DD2E7F|nr:LysM peptidoglycan-binding domain-containing protein [Verrucomicrobium sp. BvORR106]